MYISQNKNTFYLYTKTGAKKPQRVILKQRFQIQLKKDACYKNIIIQPI